MLDLLYTDKRTAQTLDALSMRLNQRSLWSPERVAMYPGHPAWAEKAIAEWQADKKMALFAFLGSECVGSIVYQQHPLYPGFLEIKNLSLERSGRGRHVANTLVRLVEIEGSKEFPGVHTVVTDTKATNRGLIRLAELNGYEIGVPEVLPTNFGHNGLPDITLSKSLLKATTLRDL